MARTLGPAIWFALVGLALAAFGASPLARADAPDASSKVYQQVLPSTVWIYSSRGKGKGATGTGTLIDRKRRLVLTNFHVVGDVKEAYVLFPVRRDGKVVAEREFYQEQLRSGKAIKGRVVARDTKVDLALIELAALPATAPALKVSAAGVEPGQTVHSIGNPGGSGALWVYTPGKVRQIYNKNWKAELDGRTVSFQAKVIETDSATNPGDSGGPLVNDKSELVGVTQGLATQARLLSTFIDGSEVKRFLGRNDVSFTENPEKKPVREKALTVKDEAKFFSAEAVAKANAAIQDILKKYERDVLIETYTTVPGGQVDKVKAMSKDDRDKFYRAWAQERLKAEKVDGVCILITRQPPFLHVEVAARAVPVLGGAKKELLDKLLASFKEKKFDEGLSAALTWIGDKLAKETKKP